MSYAEYMENVRFIVGIAFFTFAVTIVCCKLNTIIELLKPKDDGEATDDN